MTDTVETILDATCQPHLIDSDCDGLVHMTTGRMMITEHVDGQHAGYVSAPYSEKVFVTGLNHGAVVKTDRDGNQTWVDESTRARNTRVARELAESGLSTKKQGALMGLQSMYALHSQEASFYARGNRIIMMIEFVFHTRNEADKIAALHEVCKGQGMRLVKIDEDDRSDGGEGCANYEALLNVTGMDLAQVRAAKKSFYKAAGQLMGWCLRTM